MESPCHPTGQSSAGLLSTESWIEDLPSLDPQCVVLLCHQTPAQKASAVDVRDAVIGPVFGILQTVGHKNFLQRQKGILPSNPLILGRTAMAICRIPNVF